MATALFLRVRACRTAAHYQLCTTCKTLDIISGWLVSLNRPLSSPPQKKTTMILTQVAISLPSFSSLEKRFHACKTSSYTGRNSVVLCTWDDQQWIQVSTHGRSFSRHLENHDAVNQMWEHHLQEAHHEENSYYPQLSFPNITQWLI